MSTIKNQRSSNATVLSWLAIGLVMLFVYSVSGIVNDIGCKNVYDESIFTRLDQLCEDCYNLFHEPKLHSVCRQDCFTTSYFNGCVDALTLNDESEKYQDWIRRLNGVGVH